MDKFWEGFFETLNFFLKSIGGAWGFWIGTRLFLHWFNIQNLLTK